jgi:hypothetical protein
MIHHPQRDGLNANAYLAFPSSLHSKCGICAPAFCSFRGNLGIEKFVISPVNRRRTNIIKTPAGGPVIIAHGSAGAIIRHLSPRGSFAGGVTAKRASVSRCHSR